MGASREERVDQYPEALAGRAGAVAAGLGALTGEVWDGAVAAVAPSAGWRAPLPHGCGALVAGGDEGWTAGAGAALHVLGPRGEARAVLRGHDGPVTALAPLSAARVASGARDAQVRLWDLEALAPLEVRDRHETDVTLLAAAGDRWTSYSQADRQLFLWENTAPEPAAALVSASEATALAMRADELFLGLASGAVETWDLRKLDAPVSSVRHHTGAVRVVAFGEGKSVATASDDCTARLWDVDGDAGIIRHTDFVRGLIWFDGEWVTASWDKTIRFTKL